jgi:hypothetical protein
MAAAQIQSSDARDLGKFSACDQFEESLRVQSAEDSKCFRRSN